ncbi:hypothetical protein DM02DRAFT_701681 [Periconia macrospinosa]|uniref:Nephrocystin 3-like N-terminal domain-containing protein n=1 Tax=Periconia macrospinosa TaxID=97972 RepID=A0A2V1DX55_9PLEO|nr:hypothetical protein DM02DRAFT_701681 [Periconia macrospinosa]
MAPRDLRGELKASTKKVWAPFRGLLKEGKKGDDSFKVSQKSQTAVAESKLNTGTLSKSEGNEGSTTIAVPSHPDPLPSWKLSEGTNKWSEAVERFKASHPEKYSAFTKSLDGSSDTDITHLRERLDKENLPESIKKHQNSSSTWGRVRQSLQSFVTIARPVAMPVAAAVDSTRGASIACAATFFIIELALRQIQSEDYQKIMSVLSEAVFAIVEWVTFERDFVEKSLATVEEDYKELEERLPNVYQLALLILSDIYEKCSYTHIMLGIITKWEEWAKDLKLQRDDLTLRRKNVEFRIVQDTKLGKILDWVQGPENPEPSLDFIRESVLPDHRYDDTAEWFLNSAEYLEWRRSVLDIDSGQSSKRVLWLCGPYGTGKTTIYMQTLQRLENESTPTQSRIIPYICSARAGESKRPTYETILRTIARKLALLPGYSLDPVVKDSYMKQTGLDQGNQCVAPTSFWEDLLRGLFERNSQSHKLVILIDALDECANAQDVERLTGFVRDALDKHGHVHAIFTSRQHVNVGKYLPSMFYKVDITAAHTNKDMEVFIEKEVEYRMTEQKKWDKDYISVFFKVGCESLLQSLKDELLKGAKGMFIWARIWIDLMLPLHDSAKTIRFKGAANKRLQDMKNSTSKHADEQLKDAYERMWDANEIDGLRETRIRLFLLVLHSFRPWNVDTITDALRIDMHGERSYNEELQKKDVERLWANFLRANEFDSIEFIHDSGRHFVETMKITDSDKEQFTAREGNLYMAKLYISVMNSPVHPIWDSEKKIHVLLYLYRYGMRHCYSYADERSNLHGFWKGVIAKPTLLLTSPMRCQLGIHKDEVSNTWHLIIVTSESASMINKQAESSGYIVFPDTEQIEEDSETHIYSFPIDDYLWGNDLQQLGILLRFIQETWDLWKAQAPTRDVPISGTRLWYYRAPEIDRTVAKTLLIMSGGHTRGKELDQGSSSKQKTLRIWTIPVYENRSFYEWLSSKAQRSEVVKELLNDLLQIGVPEHMAAELPSSLPAEPDQSATTGDS